MTTPEFIARVVRASAPYIRDLLRANKTLADRVVIEVYKDDKLLSRATIAETDKVGEGGAVYGIPERH